MRQGAERVCMPAPTVEHFVDAVKLTVMANKHWVSSFLLTHNDNTIGSIIISFDISLQVPPKGKGSLYIRPLLMGSGEVLGLAPAPEYTFLIYVSPVGNYFKVGKVLPFVTFIIHVYTIFFIIFFSPSSIFVFKDFNYKI